MTPFLTGRIDSASVLVRTIPLRRPLRGHNGFVTTRTLTVLRLRSDDGVVGLGEASCVDWLASIPRTQDALPSLADRICIEKPAASALLNSSFEASTPSSVRAALQTALVDIESRRNGRSFASFLTAGAAHAERLELPVCALLGPGNPAEMADEAATRARQGFSCFKIKVGAPHLDDDVALVAAVRAAVGADALLRLDANGAWTSETAQRALTALARFDPEFIEEPGEYRERHHRPRIALDESVRSASDLDDAITRGGFDALVLKLERVGGPLIALAMAERATAAGLELIFTDSIESEVGRAATVHTAAAAAQLFSVPAHAIGLGGLFLLDGDIGGARPIVSAHGPGLGVEVCEREWSR